MQSFEVGLTYRFGLKNLIYPVLHAIFFPLCAAWRYWKLHMSSKKEILDDLSKYREKSSQLADDVLLISERSLEIMSDIENLLGHDEAHRELIAKIHKYTETALTGVNHVNEYSSSLLKHYETAIKKIGNTSNS